MNGEDWARVDRVFQDAADLPEQERIAFLDEAYRGDDALRTEVEVLLAFTEASDQPIRDAVQNAVEQVPHAAALAPGSRLGQWRVECLLGQGGMGAVYLVARDDAQYQKQAALKLAQRDFGSPHDLVRFRLERQILADLDHPAISRLVDGGETEDGIPFLVMEYVDGEPITHFAYHRQLSIPERLRLFALVCEAVAHAHRHLIIHRDLKPSNLLVTGEGLPKLLDFGIAKLLTPSPGAGETLASLRLYTPEYASPEQVRGTPISTATDVYGLGLVLYELLTGKKAQPLETGSPAELVEVVCERELPSAGAVDDELTAILQKALAKDPAERYPSVDLLRDDLRRYLEGLPLHARPPAVLYRAAKFARRRRWAVAAAAVLLASLAAGAGATLYQARRAERRFEQVRALSRSVLFDLHNEIQKLPGSTAAREMLIRTALVYLDNLAQDAAGDVSLQLDLASAYERVGDVLGDPFGPNLGQTAQALQNYQKAAALEQQLARRRPKDPAVLRSLAFDYLKIGDLLARTGQTAAALASYQTGLETAARLGRQPQQEQASLNIHHRGLVMLGDLQIGNGRPDAALAFYQRSLGAAERLRSITSESDGKRQTALSRVRLGDAYQELGRLEEALESYRQLLALRQAAGESPAARRNLMLAHHSVGNVLGNPFYLNLLRPAEAERHYRQALALAETLREQDRRNMLARIDVAASSWRLGTVIGAARPAEAVRLHRRAIELTNEVLTVSPDHTAYRRIQVFNFLGLGQALFEARQISPAREAFEEALAISRAVSAQDPAQGQFTHDLPIALHGLARVALEQGDLAEAGARLMAALAIAEPSAREHAQDLSCHRYLADCYEALGKLYGRRGAARQGREFHAKAVQVWQGWLDRGVDNPYLRARLAELRKTL